MGAGDLLRRGNRTRRRHPVSRHGLERDKNAKAPHPQKSPPRCHLLSHRVPQEALALLDPVDSPKLQRLWRSRTAANSPCLPARVGSVERADEGGALTAPRNSKTGAKLNVETRAYKISTSAPSQFLSKAKHACRGKPTRMLKKNGAREEWGLLHSARVSKQRVVHRHRCKTQRQCTIRGG